MPNMTSSSPVLKKNPTVYAIGPVRLAPKLSPLRRLCRAAAPTAPLLPRQDKLLPAFLEISPFPPYYGNRFLPGSERSAVSGEDQGQCPIFFTRSTKTFAETRS